MNRPVTDRLRRARLFFKTTAVLVTVAFLGLIFQPLALAVQLPKAKAPQTAPRVPTDEAKLAQTLEKIEKKLERLEEKLAKKQDATLEKDDLKRLHKTLIVLDKKAMADFEKIEKHLKAKNLPKIILDRHTQAVAQYQQELQTLRENLAAIETAQDDTDRKRKAKRAKEYLEKKQKKKPHRPLDPQKLPHRKPKVKERKPRLKQKEFQEFKPTAKLASLGPVSGLVLAQALPTPEDLAETVEVQFTQAIQDQAVALEHKPVNIYNWVRSNILFVPTNGSIQGADTCLQTRECNATDTASLLIALLRVSGIHARYVTGTIEVPIDKFKNWVGDFSDARAALNFVASGGVPVTALISGGRIVAARMEHVWVEAWIDYIPSWGAVHKEGDTWVPMEVALKPTRFQAPLDIQSAIGLDPQALFEPVLATAVQSPDGYSVTGLSATELDSGLQGVVDQLKAHITNTMPDATVGEVIGALEVQPTSTPVLPASLPGKVITIGGRTPILPASSRYKISLQVMDRSGLSEDIRLDWSTVEVAGKRITLGYVPASSADVATIESYGGLYQTPAYLISVRPVVYIDGVPAAAGSAIPMGVTQKIGLTFKEPDGTTDSVEHQVTTGGHHALGLDLQRIPNELAEAAKARLQATGGRLGVEDINWDDIVGELLHLHALSYFLQVEASNRVTAHGMNVAYTKRPSEALVSYEPTLSYFFGLPREVVDTGMTVDVRRYLLSPVSRTGDQTKALAFMRTAGITSSAAEHGVFEILQNTEAVSAVKLITEANNRGIPIFQIDSANISQILPQLQVSQDILTDIQNAVAAGKQVTIPQQELTLQNWQGTGYIVLDPATGAGAYIISGGLAGGGTAGSSPLLDMIGLMYTVLGTSQSILSFIAKAGVALTEYATALKQLGPLLAVFSAIFTTLDIFNRTGSLNKALGAGAIDFGLSLAVMAVAAAIFAVPGVGLIAAIIVSIALGIIAALLKYLIFSALGLVRLWSWRKMLA